MSFKPAPIPKNEKNRLKAVERTGVMDIVNEELYNVYTHLARKITGCPNSWANIIDKDKQFNLVMDSDDLDDKIKNQFRKIDRNISFCQYALGSTKPLIVSDMTKNPIFCDHPSVKERGITFYAAFQLINSDGYVLGSLCVEDFKVRRLSKEIIKLMKDLARKLSHQLDIQTQQRSFSIERVIDVISNLNGIFSDINLDDALIILKSFSNMQISDVDRKKLIKLEILDESFNLTNSAKKIISKLDLDTKVLKRLSSSATQTKLLEMFKELN